MCFDILVIAGLMYLIVLSARSFSIYIPFELTALILIIIYSFLLISTKGQTIGKKICGLFVVKSDGTKVGYPIGFLRECITKPIVALALPVGLVAIIIQIFGTPQQNLFLYLMPLLILIIVYIVHFVITKRTWYDIISGTIVRQDLSNKIRGNVAIITVLVISSFFIVRQTIQYVDYYRLYNNMLPYSTLPPNFEKREQDALIDISSIYPTDEILFVRWLDENADNPIDYAVDKSSIYQVVIFGETHEIKGQITFLIDAIPELYHRAGVRVIALEFCTREDNKLIDRLIASPEYDYDLALRIARNQPWRLWGMKEYWDVLYAVWLLNNSLHETDDKMRVVGIDSKWDGPSIALTVAGADDEVKAPVWEKLRIIRVLFTLPSLFLRDELMAREVEHQIIESGERGIVWVGA
jgi:uncharacterized RDD family membrane protein YckC